MHPGNYIEALSTAKLTIQCSAASEVLVLLISLEVVLFASGV